ERLADQRGRRSGEIFDARERRRSANRNFFARRKVKIGGESAAAIARRQAVLNDKAAKIDKEIGDHLPDTALEFEINRPRLKAERRDQLIDRGGVAKLCLELQSERFLRRVGRPARRDMERRILKIETGERDVGTLRIIIG